MNQATYSWPAVSTALIADGAERVGACVLFGPQTLKSVGPSSALIGRALPVVHSGSIDVFLQAIEVARPGDIIVVDDDGRIDRACLGDLVAREAKLAQIAGIIIYGCHRHSEQLIEIGIPVFSLGAHPAAPQSGRERSSDPIATCRIGQAIVKRNDVIAADADGVIIVLEDDAMAVLAAATNIRDQEAKQVERLNEGSSLRAQFEFERYLRISGEDPSYTFLAHLNSLSALGD